MRSKTNQSMVFHLVNFFILVLDSVDSIVKIAFQCFNRIYKLNSNIC